MTQDPLLGVRPKATPALGEVREIAASGKYRRIPIMRELYADSFTTIETMRRLRAASNHCFLLESAEPDQHMGRYSFLGYNPSIEITCANGELVITRGIEGRGAPSVERTRVDHPGDALRELLAQHASPQLEGFPPFTGGLMGYFSYDYLKYAEPVLRRDDMEQADFLDMDLMLFDKLIAFDSYRQRVQLIASVEVPVAGAAEGAGAAAAAGVADAASEAASEVAPEAALGTVSDSALVAAYDAALASIDEMERIITQGERYEFAPLELAAPLAPRFNREQYGAMVNTAKERIREGEIFQVVLSNPQTAAAQGSLFDTYRVLRSANPSPYMVFFSSDDIEVAAASPETLVRLQDGHLLTYPLAGTRPRGATQQEDAALEASLLADEKELAEHNMLVDLSRNDLGRVSSLGSVHVESLHDILRFSHVMHIGSTVAGELAPSKDAVDVIDAILPAGTLSGAPKIRACQIIAELEGMKRGVYGGAIGYLDFSGNLDTCIGIRLAYIRGGRVCVQSGAGIVADSDPSKEYDETINKARAVGLAIEQAQGGLS